MTAGSLAVILLYGTNSLPRSKSMLCFLCSEGRTIMEDTKKAKKKIWNKVGNGLFWTLIGLVAFYITTVTFFPAFSNELYGFSTYVVTTDSMVPVIDVNDFIVVKNTSHEELKVGYIITFRADVDYDGKPEIVTHYLANIGTNNENETYYKTHAYGKDDVTKWDSWTLYDKDIIGEYSYTVPFLGYVASFVRSGYGIAAIGVNAAIIVAIYVVVYSDKKKKLADTK